jgi:hypothetical protein
LQQSQSGKDIRGNDIGAPKGSCRNALLLYNRNANSRTREHQAVIAPVSDANASLCPQNLNIIFFMFILLSGGHNRKRQWQTLQFKCCAPECICCKHMNSKLFGQLLQDRPDSRKQDSVKRERAVIVKHKMLQREAVASGYVNAKHLGLFLPNVLGLLSCLKKLLPAGKQKDRKKKLPGILKNAYAY